MLTFSEALEAVSEGYQDRADYPTDLTDNPRRRLIDPKSGLRISNHFGISPGTGGAGALLHAHLPQSDTSRQEYGGESEAVYVLFDTDSGAVRGIIVGDLGGAEYPSKGNRSFPTALESAVGTDILARQDASQLGLFGSGRLAKNHLVAFDEIRDIERVSVFSPTQSHREKFAEEMDDVVSATIDVVDGPEAVIDGADIVLCATNASSPVFDGDLLESGQHVTSIVGSEQKLVEAGQAPRRRREIDDRTVERAAVYVANSVQQARVDEQGDFALPIENGIIDWDDVIALPEIIGGDHPGREHDDQITVYKQNSIQGVTQMALADRVLSVVEDRDLGMEIDVYDPRGAERF